MFQEPSGVWIMAYTTIDDPSAHFQAVIYTGNASSRSLTNDGNSDLQPDLVWTKKRNEAQNHCVTDSTRGVGNILFPDGADAESATQLLTSFDSDGFSINNNALVNDNTDTYVAWQWKANGGSRTTNTESGANPGGGYQANTTAGFSIVDYTGTGSAGTMAHGLGAVPECFIVKGRDGGASWRMYHHKLASDPETDAIKLDETGTPLDSDGFWNDTAPTSSVFSLGDNDNTNEDGTTYIAYLWKEIQGYSKFGSYEGNNNADGPFIYTGFKPAWVMVRNIDAIKVWYIWDNARDTFNQAHNSMQAQVDTNEFNDGTGATNHMDLLSNGFKLRAAGSSINPDAETLIYMAFAEQPFVTSGGVPCTAR